jgi:lipid-binding SYLF domain-containing protein
MRPVMLTGMLLAVGLLCLTGCQTTPKTEEAKIDLGSEVQRAINVALQTDPGIQKFFDDSAGYAVFPTVGKGAVGVGGAFGRGELFENGRMVGYCTVTQGSVGLALGGQAYTELIFFESQPTLDRFKEGKYSFTAQASAVALQAGASARTTFTGGVAVFTMAEKGLMAEAAIGGQRFSFSPITPPAVARAQTRTETPPTTEDPATTETPAP